jgi:hypothetical protein
VSRGFEFEEAGLEVVELDLFCARLVCVRVLHQGRALEHVRVAGHVPGFSSELFVDDRAQGSCILQLESFEGGHGVYVVREHEGGGGVVRVSVKGGLGSGQVCAGSRERDSGFRERLSRRVFDFVVDVLEPQKSAHALTNHGMDEDTAPSGRKSSVADPDGDPYPKCRYKEGEALFQAKYASAFFASHPELVGVKFSDLKRTCKDPLIAQVAQEFTEENNAHKRRVLEWEERWPALAQQRKAERDRESADRRKRKLRAEEKRQMEREPKRALFVPRADDDRFMEMVHETVGKLLEHQAVSSTMCQQLVDRAAWLAAYRRSAEAEKERLLRMEHHNS